MLKNPFRGLSGREWGLWLVSLTVVILSNLMTGTVDAITLTATLVGVTALIFVARGDVWGQLLTVIFSLLYSVTSWRFHYYGEIITYLGMSAPIAAASAITWMKHPYKKRGKRGKDRPSVPTPCASAVTSHRRRDRRLYFILKTLGTANLAVSTLSVATSFLASSLMLLRSSYYAVAYAANDIVLIVLWILASLKDITYLPMVANFLVFLVNDIYGFWSWSRREKKQAK